MQFLRNIIRWIMSLFTTTDQVTENTNAEQFKIVLKSPNDLPNTANTLLHLDLSNSGLIVDSSATYLASYDFLNRYLFEDPLVYNAYYKVIQSGKQLVRKSPHKNVYAYFSEYVQLYSTLQLNSSDTITGGEFFYIMFSLETKV